MKQGSSQCRHQASYQLDPPFVDKNYNPVRILNKNDYVLLHGEPNCNTHTYSGSEFHLVDDGLLHIGHHVFNYSQYCLEEVEHDNGSLRINAKVCDLSSVIEREMFTLISSNVTPALLIISEIFLFITFVLHVIVPEFRKQMFGEIDFPTMFLIL